MSEPDSGKVTVRVFAADGRLLKKETLEGEDAFDERRIHEMAVRHLVLLDATPGHVEMEFHDEPDPHQRFLRIGNSPKGMVRPVKVAL